MGFAGILAEGGFEIGIVGTFAGVEVVSVLERNGLLSSHPREHCRREEERS